MSLRGAIVGSLRGVLVAVATGAATLGLLAIVHPFAPAPLAALSIPSGSASAALQHKIEVARNSLRQTQQALDNARGGSATVTSGAPAAAERDAQMAAAIERRDLALRHARAIRDALKSGTDLDALAEVRDSVVVGQLLSQQAALDAQIAEQGARFRPTHPVMRALTAQQAALAGQIKAEAASIAAALELEAGLDDAQLKRLQSPSDGTSASPGGGPVAMAALSTERDAEQAQLDQLLDAYFSLGSVSGSSAVAAPGRADDLLSPLNLFVIGVAFIAALVVQIGLGLRRRRLHREALDMALWTDDREAEPVPASTAPSRSSQPVLRRAS